VRLLQPKQRLCANLFGKWQAMQTAECLLHLCSHRQHRGTEYRLCSLRGMGTRSIGPMIVVIWLALGHAPCSAQTNSWTVYTDERGTRIEYPADVFSVPTGPGDDGVGHVFVSRDGRARIHMYSIPNPNALAPAAFMRSKFPAPRSTLTYDRVTRNFFAISTRRDGLIIYMRCNFSSFRGGSLHCVDIRYPENEKRAWDNIVTRISRSLRPLPSSPRS
jgi:hypothetical protein